MKIKKKATISIIAVVAVLVVVISGLVYADLKKSTQSQSRSEDYIPEQILEGDPFGKEQVLIGVLNHSVRGQALGAEIGLNKYQMEQIVKIAHEEEDDMRIARGRAPVPQGWSKTYESIFVENVEKVKKLFTPLQYVRFRDWVIEEDRLVGRNDDKYYKYTLRYDDTKVRDVFPITFYTTNFLQTQIKLSKKEAEVIKQLIYQTKQEILPLREEFVEVVLNPHANEIKKEKTAEQVIKQIAPKVQKLESDILKTLPLSKRKLYKSLIEAPAGK